ncbi:MAG: hypothetical protein U5K75_12080 [Ahrensia sp.]|nr:hypothetical protein [Ahrensia sp.]
MSDVERVKANYTDDAIDVWYKADYTNAYGVDKLSIQVVYLTISGVEVEMEQLPNDLKKQIHSLYTLSQDGWQPVD